MSRNLKRSCLYNASAGPLVLPFHIFVSQRGLVLHRVRGGRVLGTSAHPWDHLLWKLRLLNRGIPVLREVYPDPMLVGNFYHHVDF